MPKSNKVQAGQKVKLMINIEEGWEVDNGKVALGAFEKVETDTGEILLDAEDLFEGKELNADDANIITISIRLPEMEQQFEYYLVSFRVWDKNGKGEVKGSYKLYME